MARAVTIAILFTALLTAATPPQPPPLPQPQTKDTVYLVHADRLLATEIHIAREQTTRDQIAYIIPGDRSTVRTPLASPVLLVATKTLDAPSLRLFRLAVKSGHREICFRYDGKSGAIPLSAEITGLSPDLYRIRVLDILPRGQYALSPDGANIVFCFEVF